MTYVFESCGYGRVQLKTDARNLHFQAAMEKMGATREGTLRHHRILLPDGRWRDSVFFFVLAEEWPGVKVGLEARLDKMSD
ncbi:GNAT family protein [Breoghania sp.]|uniref:GNAT family N-acetyltransferase n=1 Tax=Breoghania sp. TaxID=2065378 RepID=UPI00260B2F90|nr:GNAT family protein [Breoghania sp.]MDJ0930477.1 GNAT family protein [Breoghania sp.]